MVFSPFISSCLFVYQLYKSRWQSWSTRLILMNFLRSMRRLLCSWRIIRSMAGSFGSRSLWSLILQWSYLLCTCLKRWVTQFGHSCMMKIIKARKPRKWIVKSQLLGMTSWWSTQISNSGASRIIYLERHLHRIDQATYPTQTQSKPLMSCIPRLITDHSMLSSFH